jgi:hypothetical protein
MARTAPFTTRHAVSAHFCERLHEVPPSGDVTTDAAERMATPSADLVTHGEAGRALRTVGGPGAPRQPRDAIRTGDFTTPLTHAS